MDRRPMMEDQSAGGMRGAAPPATDMYSRRDAGPKPPIGGGGYGERDMGGYGTPGATAATYTPMTAATGAIGAGYTTSMAAGNYATPPAYGANIGGGYGDGRNTTQNYGTGAVAGNYNTTSGYEDPYANRTGGYDSAYPALPQQRGYC